MKYLINRYKKLIRWIPIIWKTYDWDYRFAIDVFKYQLEDIVSFMESDKAFSSRAKEDASRIKTVLKLMDKVYNEDYALEYFNKIENLYGKWDFNFIPTKDKPEYYEMVDVWEKDYSKEELKEIELVKSKLVLESKYKQKRAHKLLWSLIEHNIENWWD